MKENKNIKINVGILGATGAVGQRFLSLLEDHPFFYITDLVASEKSAGKKYGEVVNWIIEKSLPEKFKNYIIKDVNSNFDARLFFSALDSSVAAEIEMDFIKKGYVIISNAKNFRMHENVPLLLADINPDHIKLIDYQNYGKGCIITNPNCVVSGLATSLKPLIDNFEIEFVNVTTMQAVSGAGYPGVPSIDILGNIIPYIKDEESKIETEPLKILGKLEEENKKIKFADFKIFAQANRVPVLNGHTGSVLVKFKNKINIDDIKILYKNFETKFNFQSKFLNYKVIRFEDRDDYPQIRFDLMKDYGMSVSIGHLKKKDDYFIHYLFLTHNTIRGAAGAAILNGELLCSNSENLIKYNLV
ncbi:MAG: aspartate-semialdehyde dehydrogenase [Spirochaetes bacterium]|nr:aspartate-semialdehyde dehydrogenase [Spirochaetota bacterium]